MIVVEVQRFPLEEFAVRAFAGAGSGAVKGEVGGAKSCGEFVEIAGMSGPADETRLAEFCQIRKQRSGRAENHRRDVWSLLLRVGRDDFEVVFFAEREERVAGAAAGMDAAECGADARVLFDEGDACIEIAATEKDVIERDGHLDGSPRKVRSGEGAAGKSEKESTRKHPACSGGAN